MDISVYISELLYHHDCVIIPGFGGFVCNYQPAQIDSIQNTISPPSKAVSFNKNLQSNDGLLVNYIAEVNGISFSAAYEVVTNWLNSSKSLLRNNEEVFLKKVGRFFNDSEGNLQFVPDASVNYLKTSFGLKTIIAIPVARIQEIELAGHEIEPVRTNKRSQLSRIAAVVVLLMGIGSLVGLMSNGVEIRSLKLNEAGIFNFINKVFNSKEEEMKPMPVEIENTTLVIADTVSGASSGNVDSAVTASIPENTNPGPVIINNTQVNTQTSGHKYYIITGAFREEQNVEAARNKISAKYPNADILIEKSNSITKVGYSVGSDYANAKEQLVAARSNDSTLWLLKK